MCAVIRLVVTANCQNGMNVSSRISRLCFFPSTKGLWQWRWYLLWCVKSQAIPYSGRYFAARYLSVWLCLSRYTCPLVPDWNLMEKVLRQKCQIVKCINGTDWPHRLALVNFSQNFLLFTDPMNLTLRAVCLARTVSAYDIQQAAAAAVVFSTAKQQHHHHHFIVDKPQTENRTQTFASSILLLLIYLHYE